MRTTDPNHHHRARRRRGVATLLVACIAAGTAACSGGNEVADITTVAAPPTIDATRATSATVESAADTTAVETVETSSPDTSGPDTTVGGTTADTVVDTGLTGPMFSDALGVKVASAPGVNTQGDTRQLLPAGLYVHIAWEPDPNDPSVFTVQPDDIEILEAYANAVTTYYRAATTTVTTDDPNFAKYIVDAEAMFGTAFEQARDGNYVLDLGAGVVLRPYIVDRTTDGAVIYDCYLQDELYVDRGVSREPTALSARGQVVTMRSTDEQWLAESASVLGSACL